MRQLNLRLQQLRSVAGVPVAPHVAAELVEFTRGDPRALSEVASRLSPAQLGGHSLLPDPLPLVPAARRGVRRQLAGLTPTDHNRLLIAALSVVDRMSVLLAAVGTGAGPMLIGPAADALLISDGRFRFADPRVRAAVVEEADDDAKTRAHGALATALRSAGLAHAAAWHGAQAPCEPPPPLAVLLRVARQRSALGDPSSAYRVGRHVAERATGAVRANALVLAGRSAIWSGHLVDAEDSLRRVVSGSDVDLHEETRTLLDVVSALNAGPAEHPDPRVRVNDQMQQFARVRANAADRTALDALSVAFRDHLDDFDQADAVQAGLMLSVVPSRPRWPWSAEPGALSPVVDGHVRLMQVSFQLQAEDFRGAVATMRSAVSTLPLVHVGSGVAASFIRALGAHAPDMDETLSASFDELAPRRQIRFDDYITGSGDLSTAAAHRMRSGREGIEQPSATRWPAQLSGREHQVLDLVTAGLRNREIAEKLGISERTVEVHLGHIYRKCGVRSRGELLVRALPPR